MKLILLSALSLFILSMTQVQAQNSLEFDGVDEYVQTSYPGINGNSARSVIAWIKTTANADPNNDGIQQIITDWGMQVTGGRFTFNILWNDAIRVEVSGSGLSGTIAVNDGIWHQVAVTYDPDSADSFSLYVDGVLDIAGNITTAVNTVPSVDMLIGKRVDDQRFFEGEMDEVSVWDRALTLEEIIEFQCISGVPSQVDNLVAYYDFNDGTGTVLTDLAAGNDGTLENMEEEDWMASDICAGGYNVTFNVTEMDGATPVAGASVDFAGMGQSTDDNGETIFYYLEPGIYEYTVTKTGYYEQTGSLEVIGEDVVLNVLLPAILYYDVTFVVTGDPGGEPVDSAVVNVDGLLHYTDESGMTTFGDYLPGTYPYSVTKNGYNFLGGQVEIIDQDVTVDISLTLIIQEYSVTFVVLDEFLVPVDSAYVELDGVGQYTDTDGEITFAGYPSGAYPYQVSKDGYSLMAGIAEVFDEDLTVEINLLISVLPGYHAGGINFFPNPATDRLYIDLSGDGREDSQLYIMDQLGRLILSSSTAGRSAVINLDGLDKGIYILGVKSTKGAHAALFVIE